MIGDLRSSGYFSYWLFYFTFINTQQTSPYTTTSPKPAQHFGQLQLFIINPRTTAASMTTFLASSPLPHSLIPLLPPYSSGIPTPRDSEDSTSTSIWMHVLEERAPSIRASFFISSPALTSFHLFTSVPSWSYTPSFPIVPPQMFPYRTTPSSTYVHYPPPPLTVLFPHFLVSLT